MIAEGEFGACVLCGALALEDVEAFRAFRRVTSDCRPFPPGGRLARCSACGGVQKPLDQAWLDDCQAIYSEYQLYALSEGREQSVFDMSADVMRTRASIVLEGVLDQLSFTDQPRVLDYGCGRGAMVSAVSALFPGARVDGFDQTDDFEEELRRLPGFRRLHMDTVDRAEGPWDLITMSHCLEHLPHPVAELQALADMLDERGQLLIQIPNATVNPYDLVVADHRTHFSAVSLTRLLNRAGFTIETLRDDVVATELTALARPFAARTSGARGALSSEAETGAAEEDFIAGHLSYLQDLVSLLGGAARRGPVAVLGSSIAANWLIPHAPESINLVLDEDATRHGKRLFGCPIMAPSRAPAGTEVVLPFVPDLARSIASRLSHLPLTFHHIV